MACFFPENEYSRCIAPRHSLMNLSGRWITTFPVFGVGEKRPALEEAWPGPNDWRFGVPCVVHRPVHANHDLSAPVAFQHLTPFHFWE